MFFDSKGPAACATCHVGINADGQLAGSTIAPDLTAIASFRTSEHILKKIVKPDSNIVSGYEEELIETQDGRLFVGIVIEERNGKLTLSDKSGTSFLIDANDISTRTTQTGSMMPGNYDELLNEREMDDLLAYLLSLKGRP
ncbi:hypothetical protein GWO43_13065 [candidate division KSB1 bacterium]|nr:hypothetical protein [candidate division KSB1 bacterium]NIR71648.1 hypothetical protein [candidate division KSB1 bacterium]NIS25100.1 hypothetical protein [candidate division KSB1 bacterium]NIT71785.1 hypothetical protein [candidate division KSB1 bacterium]NIU25799.1 hypothetical protein [candidate division KSB1 bacterium]